MKNRLEMSDAGMRRENPRREDTLKNYSVQDRKILRTRPKRDRDRSGPFCEIDSLSSVRLADMQSVFALPYPPRSILNHLIDVPLGSLSTRILNFLKALKASDLLFKIATHINL